ncbi:glycosyltransferase family 4 protein [Pinirhizobacter soli]|uniref:glycosyltransferase family 4 protein n=1 Tax=Pinirhizobacter soli TaxID=2786953 RepID=UPI00202A6B07|nr:glycosyltransferase family 4 protein [Pinirhizobacter soli]
MRIAVVTVRPVNGEEGGAERLFNALVEGFRLLGHEADEVTYRTDEAAFETVLGNYLHFYDLDLSAYDVVISTKAPTWMIRHPRHVCYLIHTMRVFYDMFDQVFPVPGEEVRRQRELIHRLDSECLAPPACRKVYSIGHEVSRRLLHWNDISADVLHPPLWNDEFKVGPEGDYLFLPGRMHAWKRVDLVIEAMRQVDRPVRLVLAGTGDAEPELRSLAAGDDRIEFLGRISDTELVSRYAGALAVPFTPLHEDYGYVTLEAFASGKAVVTCSDSGEAALIVREQNAGIVCDPDPTSLARALERIIDRADERRSMADRGKAWVDSLSWKDICNTLVEAGMS